jgi:hypothetical protein
VVDRNAFLKPGYERSSPKNAYAILTHTCVHSHLSVWLANFDWILCSIVRYANFDHYTTGHFEKPLGSEVLILFLAVNYGGSLL